MTNDQNTTPEEPTPMAGQEPIPATDSTSAETPPKGKKDISE